MFEFTGTSMMQHFEYRMHSYWPILM